MTNEYTHIDKNERNEIKAMLEKGYTQADIARALGRSKSSISREIRRNSIDNEYVPEKADHKAYVRRRAASFKGKKIAMDASLRTYVEAKLESGWSPELIAGRLKHIRNDLPHVSKNTVYRYLDSVYGNGVDYEKKARQSGTDGRKTKLNDRTFIDDRPDIADRRGRIGDWEMDFVESGKSSTAVLLVLVDRLSRYVVVRKLTNKKAASVHEAVMSAVREIPVRSMTTDNDIALQKHKALAQAVQTAIFFCHPYASWEKGSVEKINQLLRSWIPKGSDIATYDREYIQTKAEVLNERPRKCLDFFTPGEVMGTYQLLDTRDIARDTLFTKVAERCV